MTLTYVQKYDYQPRYTARNSIPFNALVVESADTRVLEALAVRRNGSSPFKRTNTAKIAQSVRAGDS